MNLTRLFDLSFKQRRDQPALEWMGRTYTFGEVETRSRTVAAALLERGIARGDRLCVYLTNCIELIDLYLACVRIGAIFVPVNILYKDREIQHILNDSQPRALVTTEALDVRTPVWRPEELYGGHPLDEDPWQLDGDDPAALVYTSGTTGVAKGAILSHNNFAANALNLLTCWKITESDRFLLALPLFHVHALGNGLHCWLISGCRMRLLDRFAHDRTPAEFRDFRPTLFFGVPTMYVRMLDWDRETVAAIRESMRLFVSGSAPLPAQVLEDFEQRMGHRILERYGMSETLMNLSNPYAGERRAGSVGFPLPGVSVRLVTPSGADAANEEAGEVLLRGPNVFQGYWGRESATRDAFSGGWFKTGDLGVRSEDGYYTLCGRRSDLIISGGFNIYPREIEEFLMEQPEIAEAAVTGNPDRVRGEVPVAYIVLKSAVDTAELESRCRAQLASFKLPRSFVVVDSLPRNALGKVQKHLLPR